jgi:hypothetical protein
MKSCEDYEIPAAQAGFPFQKIWLIFTDRTTEALNKRKLLNPCKWLHHSTISLSSGERMAFDE